MPFISFFLIVFCILVLDQATKHWALHYLPLHGPIPVFKGVFDLSLVYNQGAAFGMLQGGTFLLSVVSVACVAAILLMLCRREVFVKVLGLDPQDPCVRVALALIMGGAVGNLIDRLRLSYVVDFLHLHHWPVFNVADSAITVGGILIAVSLLKKNPRTSHGTGSV